MNMFKRLNYEMMNEKELMNVLHKDWMKLFKTLAYSIVCIAMAIVLYLWQQKSVYFYGTLSIGFFFLIIVYMIHVASDKCGWGGILGLILFFVFISKKIENYDEIFPYMVMIGSFLLFLYYCVLPIIEILWIKKKTGYTYGLEFGSSMKLLGSSICLMLSYCVGIVATFFLGIFEILEAILIPVTYVRLDVRDKNGKKLF